MKEITIELKIIIIKKDYDMLKKIQEKTNAELNTVLNAICLSGFHERISLLYALLKK